MSQDLEYVIRNIPKAELHLHIEGTLEPELMFALAERNRVSLPYRSVAEVRAAYRFADLQSFLDLYYQGMRVLVREEDFYDLTAAYLARAKSQRIRHCEIFFDPQGHTGRGVSFEAVISGIRRAQEEAARGPGGVTSHLILCFLRHLSPESALETLLQAVPYRSWIRAVGLDSSELGNPPERFAAVFTAARTFGFPAVVHAGEEGPPAYIWQALDLLQAVRIDHGVRCLEDPLLVQRLRDEMVPLTVCPLSNVRLGVFPDLARHNLKLMLDEGLCVTVNSDDPAYFGGDLTENLIGVQRALGLDLDDIKLMVEYAFVASFLEPWQKAIYLDEVGRFCARFEAGD